MFILSQDKKRLVNSDNVGGISIEKMSETQYHNIDVYVWQIRAVLPSIGTILAKYNSESECQKKFDDLTSALIFGDKFFQF